MALSVTTIKYVQSLRIKKFRQKYHHFVVEGDKAVRELLLSGWEIEEWFYTNDFKGITNSEKGSLVSAKEMERLSHHKTPQNALAVVRIPEWEQAFPERGLHVFLDGIRDPGNLGTILRVADWYGLKEVWCSDDTVDLFNPKSIDASMGSFLRVKLIVTDSSRFFSATPLPVYAAVMDGDNVHEKELASDAVLVIGNEGQGIRPEVLGFATEQISIPRYGSAESLNAGIAAAILLDNFFR